MSSLDANTLHQLMTILLGNLYPKGAYTYKGNTLKVLRLVSKVVGSLATAAVQSCEVYLGEAGSLHSLREMVATGVASPNPRQLVDLLAGTQLKKFKVTIITASGLCVPTVTEQLAACTSQMDFLLRGMGDTISSIMHLTLNIVIRAGALRNSIIARDDQVAGKSYFGKNGQERAVFWFPQDTHLSSYDVMSGSMYTKLAQAVPNLQELCLHGRIHEAALQAFGDSCPLLHNLEVMGPHIPVQVLQNIDASLPNLRCVRFTNEKQDWDDEVPPNDDSDDEDYDSEEQDSQAEVCDREFVWDLGSWIDCVFPKFKHCKHLWMMDVDFSGLSEGLGFAPEVWQQLPPSLRHLRVACQVEDIESFDDSISKLPLQMLTLRASPWRSLVNILQEYPHLQALEVLGDESSYNTEVFLHCSESDDPPGYALMKERLLGGSFSLKCNYIGFEGTSTEILDTLAWLPPFIQAPRFSVSLVGSSHLVEEEQISKKVRKLLKAPDVEIDHLSSTPFP